MSDDFDAAKAEAELVAREALRPTASSCTAFEPCRVGDEGDDPAHNFTCALLCITCGLPREKHAAPQECLACGTSGPCEKHPATWRGAGPIDHAAGSEQPDRPHEWREWSRPGKNRDEGRCGICGQPESAHRRKP